MTSLSNITYRADRHHRHTQSILDNHFINEAYDYTQQFIFHCCTIQQKNIKINKNKIRSLLIQPQQKAFRKSTAGHSRHFVLMRLFDFEQKTVQCLNKTCRVEGLELFQGLKSKYYISILRLWQESFFQRVIQTPRCGHPALALGAYFTSDAHIGYAHLQ